MVTGMLEKVRARFLAESRLWTTYAELQSMPTHSVTTGEEHGSGPAGIASFSNLLRGSYPGLYAGEEAVEILLADLNKLATYGFLQRTEDRGNTIYEVIE